MYSYSIILLLDLNFKTIEKNKIFRMQNPLEKTFWVEIKEYFNWSPDFITIIFCKYIVSGAFTSKSIL
jgi:hypothetical protein